ncbi:MAG: hypothetical protein QM673_14155, partial [Gordonia sp. (in: high G+C Gram-positive bacteria)]
PYASYPQTSYPASTSSFTAQYSGTPAPEIPTAAYPASAHEFGEGAPSGAAPQDGHDQTPPADTTGRKRGRIARYFGFGRD